MKVLVVACTAILFSSVITAAQITQSTKYHPWWNDQYPQKPLNSPNATKLPLITVKGNKFVDPQGNVMLFRGMAIADPDKIEHQGHWNLGLFQHVQQTGAKVVRIPVHPIAWRERGVQNYLALNTGADGCTIELQGTVKELAGELGLTHEALYRTLRKLEAEGKIARAKDKILLKKRTHV